MTVTKINHLREFFKDIPNYNGRYQVSNLGRVKSIKNGKERILKANSNEKRDRKYNKVCLYKDGKMTNNRVHTLVAKTFIDSDYISKNLVVDHINNNQLDNRLINLQLLTRRQNDTKERVSETGFTGVTTKTLVSGKIRYVSAISINNKRKHLGTFNTPEEASNKYQQELKKVS